MATIDMTPDEVIVRLRGLESIGALRRKVRMPRAAITGVAVVDDPYRLGAGIRTAGITIPGSRRVGFFRTKSGRLFVAARKGQHGVQINFERQPFQQALLSVENPEDVAAALREHQEPTE
jgi:hypothetical protein